MGRRGRSRRSRSTPFRSWGLVLTLLLVVLLWQRLWMAAAAVGGLLVLYLLAFRLTRCRVETTFHRPCLWLVRGLMGTCDYHTGYKRGVPVLTRGRLTVLPMFMWRRDFDLRASQVERPPSPGETTTARASRPGYDWAMLALTIAGVIVAVAALIRDAAAA